MGCDIVQSWWWLEDVESEANPGQAGAVCSLDLSFMKWGFFLAKAVINNSNNNNNNNNNNKAVFCFSAEDKWEPGARTLLKRSAHH